MALGKRFALVHYFFFAHQLALKYVVSLTDVILFSNVLFLFCVSFEDCVDSCVAFGLHKSLTFVRLFASARRFLVGRQFDTVR